MNGVRLVPDNEESRRALNTMARHEMIVKLLADRERGNGIRKRGSKMTGIIIVMAVILALCRLAYEIGKIDGHDEGMENVMHELELLCEEARNETD